MKYYTVDINGRKEDLPILSIGENLNIAFFNLHGAQELTEHCGKCLAERLELYEPEVILTAESKGLQLAHCIARELGHKFYAVSRKSKKLYMQDGIETTAKSITTAGEQTYYLSRHDVELMKGKRILIVDDVVSLGESLKAVEKLVNDAGGIVCGKMFILAEGNAANRDDIIFLEKLPLFNPDGSLK